MRAPTQARKSRGMQGESSEGRAAPKLKPRSTISSAQPEDVDEVPSET